MAGGPVTEASSAGGRGSAFVGAAIRGDAGAIDGLAAEWTQLCDAPGNALPFTRPEWVRAYHRNYDGPPFVALTARQDGRLAGLLPLFRQSDRLSRIPIRVLLAPSGFMLWPMDVLVADEATRPEATAALWAALRRMGGWDVLEIPNVPAGGAAENLLAAARASGFQTLRWEYMHSPYISLREHEGVRDALQIARSSKLRTKVRRALQKADQLGGLERLHVTEPDPLILKRFYELEAAGWKGKAGSAVASREKDRAFTDATLAEARARGYLSIHALRVGAEVAAVMLGLTYRRTYFAMKLGVDEDLKALSLGHLMIHAILDDCLRGPFDRVDLMGLESDWKLQWTASVRPHAMCYVFNGRIYGRLLQYLKRREIRQDEREFSNRHERLSGGSGGAEDG